MFEIRWLVQKQASNYTIFVDIKKSQKMAKWSNNFISGKQLKKGRMATLV